MATQGMSSADLPFTIHHQSPSDLVAIEKLHERVFGPGRFARTAFRLREGVEAYPDLSFIARVGTLMVGSIQLWPLLINAETPAILLGPVTIEPVFQSKGIGGALIRRSLEAAKAKGHRLMLLVGDAAYYTRFGFTVVPYGRLRMPGPVYPARFLVCELTPGAFESVSGTVRGDPSATAALELA